MHDLNIDNKSLVAPKEEVQHKSGFWGRGSNNTRFQ
jgi:hypothetical protein